MKKSLLLIGVVFALALITSCKKKETAVPPVTPAPTPGTVQTMPYTQSFMEAFGTYSPINVVGDQEWKIDYSSAVMTGHIKEGDEHLYFENEDWLISSPVNITNVEHARMVMNYAAKYTGPLNDITIQVSSDYTTGSMPETATWTVLPVTIENQAGSAWTFSDLKVSLDAFIGQKVVVAVKFTSTATQSRTIEIKSITIEEGEATPGPGPVPGGDVQSMPYEQSFASSFGTYMTYDVAGSESWEIAYNTAKMTGYVGGTNYANEDWLISSPVAITGVSDAKLTMVYIGRYFTNISEDVTIWVSTNYVFGENPTTATWAQVPATLSEGSNWNDFKTIDLSLTAYVGQTATVAVKYVSTEVKAGTIEIQSLTVQEGSVTPGPGPTPPPGPGTGSGTADDPYNVVSGINLQGQDVTGWVRGYIVGAVKNGLSTVTSNDDVNWSAPFDSFTNVVIADDANCNEITNCIIVNLPSGKPLRAQVNLYDNPDNLGKQLSVLGKLRTYFGQAGLRDSNGTESDFTLEGYVPPTPGETIFSETFASGQGLFTIQDVVLPEELTYVWAHASQYSCMKASAYVSQAYATESWLVSPNIDLTGVSTANLNFSQAVNYASPNGALAVMISTDYNGDVNTANWTELSLDNWPAGSNWTFVTSNANLDSYTGQIVNIAFKYTSTSTTAATWEVKNFVVEE